MPLQRAQRVTLETRARTTTAVALKTAALARAKRRRLWLVHPAPLLATARGGGPLPLAVTASARIQHALEAAPATMIALTAKLAAQMARVH